MNFYPYLQNIINMSLKTAYLPHTHKRARVRPLLNLLFNIHDVE